ncbi:MAG: RNA methyltransferase, partial [Candidatus Eremiobacteraeota bacterium]|nr:RNA methyltransferase [Candidatus Eremiobacteraeota bacterium]
VLAVGPSALTPLSTLFEADGIVLALADVNDPGNAGTLLRSAEAFGITRVVFGALGAEPYHPKVVRGAMGAIFRQQVAIASPEQFAEAAGGWTVTGLRAGGEDLDAFDFAGRHALIVGNERRGLGIWEPLCSRVASIRMHGAAESLNAAVAGSIALYEATKRRHG